MNYVVSGVFVNVVYLARHCAPNADTVSVLRAMLAKAERGEVQDISVSYVTRDGAEKACWTGRYKDPQEVISCSLRWAQRLLKEALS